ncbi:transcription factor TFIIE beta subunit, TFIIEB, Tfa2 [Sorochytrium milnesiophthora]
MSNLGAQGAAFARALASQPVIHRNVNNAGSNAAASASSKGSLDHLLDRPRKKPMAQRVTHSTSRGSVFAQSVAISDALKRAKGPMTPQQIYETTKIYLAQNPQLETAMRTDPHIVWDASNKTYAWKADFQIHTKEELLAFVRDRASEGGVDVSKLKESCPNVVALAKDLAAEKLVYILANAKDQSPRFLFNNPHPPVVDGDYDMDPEVKEIWNKLQVPDDVDLRKQLEAAGMKEQKTFEQKAEQRTKQKKRAQRRVKLTNTHLAGTGIDLQGVLSRT